MINSQQSLIRAIKNGCIVGELESPQYIETVLSHIFVFPQSVYKIYKSNNDFVNRTFLDLSDRSVRWDFTQEDFSWNYSFSPSIYQRVTFLSLKNGTVSVQERSDFSEMAIQMKRVDTDRILFESLRYKNINTKDAFLIGKHLGSALRSKQMTTLGMDVSENFRVWLQDLKEYSCLAKEHLSQKESAQYCGFLESWAKRCSPYFRQDSHNMLGMIGDIHAGNAVYMEGTLLLIDTFQPKPSWRYGNILLSCYHMGADIWALCDRERYDSYLLGWERGALSQADQHLESVGVLSGVFLRTLYLYILGKTDPKKREVAKRYHAFLRKFFEENCKKN